MASLAAGLIEPHSDAAGRAQHLHRGFARAEIDDANSFCCGAMTLEGAPHLKPKHALAFARRVERIGKFRSALSSNDSGTGAQVALFPEIAAGPGGHQPPDAPAMEESNALLGVDVSGYRDNRRLLRFWWDRGRCSGYREDTVFHLPGHLRRNAADGFDGQKKPAYLALELYTRFTHDRGRVSLATMFSEHRP